MIHPAVHRKEKLGAVERSENATKRIVTGHAVGQLKILKQPIFLRIGKAFSTRPAIAAADRRRQRQENQLRQRGIIATLGARIGNSFKVMLNLTRWISRRLLH